MRLHKPRTNQGITLIEVLISFTLFVFVLTATLGSIISILSANGKAHAVQSAATNLNFALENMARNIRVGSNYRCEDSAGIPPVDFPAAPTPQLDDRSDCPNGSSAMVFEASDGNRTENANDDQIIYRLNKVSANCVDSSPECFIERTTKGGAVNTWFPITAPEIHIQNLEFFVVNTATLDDNGDEEQPMVVILISGLAGVGTEATRFDVQTSVTQRVIDF